MTSRYVFAALVIAVFGPLLCGDRYDHPAAEGNPGGGRTDSAGRLSHRGGGAMNGRRSERLRSISGSCRWAESRCRSADWMAACQTANGSSSRLARRRNSRH